MRVKIALLFAVIASLISACQGGAPPTIYAIEVTRIVTVVVTEDSNGVQTADLATAEATIVSASATPSITNTPSPTPTVTQTSTPDVFPTPAIGQVYVAEQSYERGRMVWLEPIDQIWIITTNADGTNTWAAFDDTFEEGMLETDSDIVAPDGLYQPERGFGKLWRENDAVRDMLGWAVEPEFGYVTRYEYNAGGTVTVDNTYEPGPGNHVIETLNRELLRFNEGIWTWEITQLN